MLFLCFILRKEERKLINFVEGDRFLKFSKMEIKLIDLVASDQLNYYLFDVLNLSS